MASTALGRVRPIDSKRRIWACGLRAAVTRHLPRTDSRWCMPVAVAAQQANRQWPKRVRWWFTHGRTVEVEGQESERILAALASRSDSRAGAAGTAAAVASLCEDIGRALAPIVGHRGVAVLYKRSLFLASHEHPVLAGLHEDVQTVMDVSRLRATLISLSESEVTPVGAALLLSFHELLSSLVGSSLTERLLRSLWARPLSDPPTMEPGP